MKAPADCPLLEPCSRPSGVGGPTQPSDRSLTVSWIQTLYYEGVELHAGMSWVEIELEGADPSESRLLGYILPDEGMFSLNGQQSLFLAFYPTLQATLGSEISQWHTTYTPPTAVIPLAQVRSLRALWPVRESVDGGVTTRSFVRY